MNKNLKVTRVEIGGEIFYTKDYLLEMVGEDVGDCHKGNNNLDCTSCALNREVNQTKREIRDKIKNL